MLKDVKILEVYIHGKKAGRLGETPDARYAFEYDPDFLRNGFSISPFFLPLRQELFLARQVPFNGLFGVFADSLPDGWGRLLIDRLFIKYKIDPATVTQAQRLSVAGAHAMGALEYRRQNDFFRSRLSRASVLDLAAEVKKVLHEDYSGDLELLAKKGGSSGGARPKALIEVKGEPWIVKFPNSTDPGGAGAMEYAYSLAAKKCGVEMPQTALLEKKYYAVKRFDRRGKKKIHMHSAAGLLHADYRVPSLDYAKLIKATMALTGDINEVIKLFRLMVFNILSRNRDDHAKNFSFLYDGGKWAISPAYDLVYSGGFNGQHTTTLLGTGTPGKKEIMQSGKDAGIKPAVIEEIYDSVSNAVKPLEKYAK